MPAEEDPHHRLRRRGQGRRSDQAGVRARNRRGQPRVYVGDITYIWTQEGWLYLATVIDLASRRLAGWAMADHMHASLVCDALTMAVDARRPGPGLIFHSDRGVQHTSGDYTRLLEATKMVQSLSRPGQCWDNAVAESWFSTPKNELIHRRSWPTRTQARRAIFEYIELFYNRRRLHSSLGYLTPVEYEQHALTVHQHPGHSSGILNPSGQPGHPHY